jgi:type I restriction enzyme S subunit
VSEENELPEGWCWTTLGQCFTVHIGATPSRQKLEYWKGNIPWVSSGEVQFCRIRSTREYITQAGFNNSSIQINPIGSVLLGMIGEGKTRGQAAILDIEACNNQNCAAIWVSQTHIISEYIYYWLLFQYDITRQVGSGNNQPALNKSRVEQFVFPLSPLLEQQRIVAAIEQQFTRLDSAVTALKHTKAKLKRYRASVLKAAVEGKLTETWRAEHPATEPANVLLKRILVERRAKWDADQRAKGKDPAKVKYVEPAVPDVENLPGLPEGWGWATLEQLTSAVRPICYGILMPKENVPNGVLYVKVKDMKGDKINIGELHRTTFEIAAGFARASLAPGDLLLAIRGTYGRIAEVPDELDGANITQDTARLAIIKFISSAYIAVHLRSPNSQKYFREAARGVAVKGVNIADVRLTPIELPPLSEQQEIVSEVERRLSIVTQLEATVEANLKRAERLRQSILKEAFAGRLVPQDPDDEPASVLLERIHKEREGQKQGPIKKARAIKAISAPRMPDVEPMEIDASEMEQMDLWANAHG